MPAQTPPSDRARTIVWFDRDLRVADHAPLTVASTRGEVIPVFVWSPEDDGAWAPGAAFRWYMHGALQALDGALSKLGAPLIVRRGPANDVIPQLVDETGADAVYWHRRYTPTLAARDDALRRALGEREVDARAFPGRLLHDPSAVRTKDGRSYRVFTPFWRNASAALKVPVPIGAPATLRGVRGVRSEPIDALSLRSGDAWEAKLDWAWEPSEAAANDALARFASDTIDAYATQRDFLGSAGTSRLSAPLAHGTLSPRQVWTAASGAAGGAPYLRQLGWREFAWHVLIHNPHTPHTPLAARFSGFPWRDDPGGFDAWTRGLTGYELVDAGMRELWETGWMHNRARMVVASFLTKHLMIEWSEGARWFWDTLVDADLANNTLGWQWAGGCGADAAPYVRVFNPMLQAERFDAERTYRDRWCPTPAPEPIVDHAFARQRALGAYEAVSAS